MDVTVTIPGGTARILALIRSHPDGRTGLAVRTIADLLGVPPGPALRMHLSRAVKHGKLRRLDNGVYADISSFIEPPLPDPRVRFHGLGAYSMLQTGDRGVFRRVQQTVTANTDPLNQFRNKRSKCLVYRGDWEGRFWTVTLAESTGRASVWLRASNAPLHLLELAIWFDGAVPVLTGIPAALWKVDQAGVNFDIPGAKVPVQWQMTFDEGLSIAGFTKVFIQVYDKVILESGRVDVHLSVPDPGGISADLAMRLAKTCMESVEIIAAREEAWP